MKLPNKLNDVSEVTQNGAIIREPNNLEIKNKINEIISYLSELHEQQKPCEHKGATKEDDGNWYCKNCEEYI